MSTSDTPITRILVDSEARHWQGVINRCRAGEAVTLKEDGGTRVLRLLAPPAPDGLRRGPDLIVKRWELKTFGSQLKSMVRMSRAWRHWKGAKLLAKAGVGTARCHAIMETRENGVPVEWLIMECLPGKTLLQHLADRDLSVAQEHAAARAAGAMLDRLIAHKRQNRDGKPSNLIIAWDSALAAPSLSVIDCVAIRRLSDLRSDEALVRMFAHLVIEPLGCKCLPRRALMMRALRAYYESYEARTGIAFDWGEARNLMWPDIEKMVRLHGDPTPKVNPLGPPT